jgi:hypothetical protein
MNGMFWELFSWFFLMVCFLTTKGHKEGTRNTERCSFFVFRLYILRQMGVALFLHRASPSVFYLLGFE